MAIAQSHYWRCVAEPGGKLCGKIFHDPSGEAPCPTCGNSDDSLIEPTTIEVQVKEVPQSKTQPVPTTQAKPAQAPKQTAQAVRPLRVMPTGRAVGMVALGLGSLFWIEGARAIRDGINATVNWLLDRMWIPFDLPHASEWPWQLAVAVMLVLGVLFRVVEINYMPFRMPPRLRQFFQFELWTWTSDWIHWSVWVALIVIDVLMVYVGARTDPAPLAITEQIAANGQIAAIYAIIVTFLPDRVIQWGWRRLFPRSK